MIKTVIFRCKLKDVNCQTQEELLAFMERVGASIQTIHNDVQIDPNVEIEVENDVQYTSVGEAVTDAYLEIKKKNGDTYYKHSVGGVTFDITKEEYDLYHSSPQMQAQLQSARDSQLRGNA